MYLMNVSEPTRRGMMSYDDFCFKDTSEKGRKKEGTGERKEKEKKKDKRNEEE